jgi:hypothetical protein
MILTLQMAAADLLEKLAKKFEKLSLQDNDTVVIGTRDDRLPITPAKSEEDGRYHLSGDLQIALVSEKYIPPSPAKPKQ